MRARIAWALTACLLSACATMAPLPAVAPTTAPAGFPIDFYRGAAARGEAVFRVDPQRSLVVVRVYRAGALARFGHDHVVASRAVQGYVLLAGTADARRADVYAPLATLSVDEPALRAQAGFDTQPSQQDIEGTRRNMLQKVLDAAQHPFVSLHLASVTGEAPELMASAAITLHERTYTTPVTIALDTPSPTQLYARGRFSVKQTDFGIEPYALLGGALRVEDRMDIEFEIAATRVGADRIAQAGR
jgi:polyisoprenoid-binding protein YceI